MTDNGSRTTPVPRHILLVGLPGSGKSTVGPMIASALTAPFVDLDRVIADRAGLSIPQVFETLGEPRFREMEREELSRVLDGVPAVIAAGGGWAAQAGNLESAGPRALTVYLRVSADVAASRAATAPGTRPLLGTTPDIKERMIALLSTREAYYQRSEAVVDASGSSQEVALEVVSLARSLGGWY